MTAPSMRSSQKPVGSIPKDREVFNSFKERLVERLMNEQARSLTKEDTIAQFMKRTSALNAFVNTHSTQIPDEEDEVSDDGMQSASLEGSRMRATSRVSEPKQPSEEEIRKIEIEQE